MLDMRRREFITLLGGAAAAWPLAARAQQQRERARRIGGLFAISADDSEGQARLAAFAQGLQQSGWTSARTCGLSTALPAPIPMTCVGTRRN